MVHAKFRERGLDRGTTLDDGYIPDWQFMEDYIKSLHHKPLTTKNKAGQVPELKVTEWKEFVFKDIFKLRGGFYNKKPEHSIEGNIPFLASTEANNGVTECYSIEDIEQWDKVGNEDYSLDKKMFDGNCIAVTVNGSVCNAFYQPERFTCSHDITVLYLKKHTLNPYIGLFLCTMIMMDKYRWSYGRKPHDVKKFGKSIIILPVDSNGNPLANGKSQHLGMGYLNVTVEEDQILYMTASTSDGLKCRTRLPKALKTGAAINVTQRGESLFIRPLFSDDIVSGKFTVVIYGAGNLYEQALNGIDNKVIRIPTNTMREGVVNVALLDSNSNILSERMCFIRHPRIKDNR